MLPEPSVYQHSMADVDPFVARMLRLQAFLLLLGDPPAKSAIAFLLLGHYGVPGVIVVDESRYEYSRLRQSSWDLVVRVSRIEKKSVVVG